MKANYHTHTERCNHAIGSDEDFVLSAIKGNYDEIGFSDHSPWQYDSNFIPQIRMRLKEFDNYYQSIMKLKEKYKDQISIKIGLECEYFPAYMEWLKTFIKEKKIDYIIFGNHFDGSDEDGVYYGHSCDDDEIFKKYIKSAIEGLHTGLYSCLAHPDLFMRGRSSFDKLAESESIKLCKVCKELNIPLEYNLEGMYVGDRRNVVEYPNPSFWKIASQIGNDVIIGVDAHNNQSLESDYYRNKALKELEILNMNVLDTIEYKF